MFKKVLVANRGEIAVRILRTLREMGIRSVAVFSEADARALHVRCADEAVAIGPTAPAESYLNMERLLDAAKRSGAEAIHPGYGFLSENAAFAAACEDQGLTFIGPPSTAIASMGQKTTARKLMAKAGVPIVPGGNATTLDEALTTAEQIGYPVMLKAVAGGGGKGMRLVRDAAGLASAFELATSEARKAFGDGTLYLEKLVVDARHVEIQVLGDRHGRIVHLFERDCSVQRRHQKVIEETPCPAATPELVQRMGEVAVAGARAVGYHSAGTFEFLLSPEGSFYFLEMNSRLQVEHPITELVTGLDLVREMVRVAAGEHLGYDQSSVVRRGAAIECRVYAEDADQGFLPSPGTISELRAPSGPGIRDDSGVETGSEISAAYDPLISKLCVWAPDRPSAIARMQRALGEYIVGGVRTNLAFHQRLLAHPEFVAGRYSTEFIERHADALLRAPERSPAEQSLLAVAAALAAHRQSEQSTTPISSANTGALSPWVSRHRSRL